MGAGRDDSGRHPANASLSAGQHVAARRPRMKVAVIGLWHLGAVTAACLADAGHDVTAYDGDPEVVAQFARGAAAVHEPGLNESLQRGLERGALRATTDLRQA